MSAQEPGSVEGPETLAAHAERVRSAAIAQRLATDTAAAAMLRLCAARGAHAQEQARSEAQAEELGRIDVPERGDAEGDQKLRVPRLWKVAVGEGYCLRCHYVVAAHNGWLNDHYGYYAGRYTDNKPCPGSGHRRWPIPNNPIDPWSWDRKRGAGEYEPADAD
jgi:hypothetical protein